eukprot:TRINITY_DN8986_c0_g1_i1.p1 TRINITY_DN8986_c0_g1~~TRINITY_DN8986_c0_g1_i1.p1  ORF type:complete len:178 (+),score=51.63 TRINITY_DN8986_c0_g1_i1:48-581(+)
MNHNQIDHEYEFEEEDEDEDLFGEPEDLNNQRELSSSSHPSNSPSNVVYEDYDEKLRKSKEKLMVRYQGFTKDKDSRKIRECGPVSSGSKRPFSNTTTLPRRSSSSSITSETSNSTSSSPNNSFHNINNNNNNHVSLSPQLLKPTPPISRQNSRNQAAVKKTQTVKDRLRKNLKRLK